MNNTNNLTCEYTIPGFLNKMFVEWSRDNGREPLYFVIHPDDYRTVYAEYVSMCAINPDWKVFGINVLISPVVPRGEFKFVG